MAVPAERAAEIVAEPGLVQRRSAISGLERRGNPRPRPPRSQFAEALCRARPLAWSPPRRPSGIALDRPRDECSHEGDHVIHAIKEGPTAHEHTTVTLYGPRAGSAFLRGVRPPPLEVLEAARARHRLTPFFLTSADADSEWDYAVIVRPPDATYVVDARKIQLVSTILRLDVEKLLRESGAMA